MAQVMPNFFLQFFSGLDFHHDRRETTVMEAIQANFGQQTFTLL
jgi:hypothetical protein